MVYPVLDDDLLDLIEAVWDVVLRLGGKIFGMLLGEKGCLPVMRSGKLG